MTSWFNVGGLGVYMTDEQAARWTSGTFTDKDRSSTLVYVAEKSAARVLRMADALADRRLSVRLKDQPAKPWVRNNSRSDPPLSQAEHELFHQQRQH